MSISLIDKPIYLVPTTKERIRLASVTPEEEFQLDLLNTSFCII